MTEAAEPMSMEMEEEWSSVMKDEAMWKEDGMWTEDDMMEMDAAYACKNAMMIRDELMEYGMADDEGKKMKEEEWSKAIEDAVSELWEDMDGAAATTTFAATVAAVVAALAF